MRLSDSERDYVARTLMTRLGANPYAHLQGLFGPEVNRVIPLQTTPWDFALETISACELRYPRDPSWMNALLDSLGTVTAVEIRVRLARERESAARAAAAASDPFSDTRLYRGEAFLDRRKLRDALRRLASDQGPNVLVVNGPPGSGRSYTRALIEHAARRLATFEVAWIPLEEAGVKLEPDGLAWQIACKLGRRDAPVPARQSTGKRWAQDLALWLLSLPRPSDPVWWILLDGFDDPDIPEDTIALVQNLALHICSGEAQRRFRLVLLEYPRPLPHSIRRAVVPEELQPPESIGEVDVREHFESLFVSLNQALEPEALTRLVASVMEGLPPSGDRLVRLCQKVEEVSDALVS
jgi:hypothetical protein